MTTGPWRGRSLAFVRQMTRSPAHYGSARQAYQASKIQTGPPPPGTIVWFEGGPWGDCALSLGQGHLVSLGVGDRILAISPVGFPFLTTIESYPSAYLGWSHEIGQALPTSG